MLAVKKNIEVKLNIVTGEKLVKFNTLSNKIGKILNK